MKKVFIYICMGHLFWAISIQSQTRKALVIQPIIDLVGQPLPTPNDAYHQLPIAGSNGACARLHQLLYNEVVNIIKEKNDQYCIEVPDIFYITTANTTPQRTFWTHKNHLMPLEDIPQAAHAHIPALQKNKEITLIMPWESKQLACTFSAGTRFVIAQGKARPRHLQVYAYDTRTKKSRTLWIPTHVCIQMESIDTQKKREHYCHLLRTWAHMPGLIPYVWGGCSLTYLHKKNATFQTIPINKQEQCVAYSYADEPPQKSGVDCAGLITRAAHTAGLIYPYKNTTTLAHYLTPVPSYDACENGDLIWIPGHVMAIGNKEKGLIIEARHYSHGYGKVQEIPLARIFKGITSCDMLFAHIAQKKPLERLDVHGKVIQRITNAKILSMNSCIEGWSSSPAA